MKRLLFLTAITALLVFACNTERGYLSIAVTADKAEANVGQTIIFNVALPEGDELQTGNFYIYDSDGVQVNTDILSTTTFEYTFLKTDSYSIKVQAVTKKDYGNAFTDVSIISTMNLPDWTLADDGNANSSMAGEEASFTLTSLFTDSIDTLDFRIINADTNETIFFEQNIEQEISTITRPTDFGNYIVVVTLNDTNGNLGMVSDQFIILNPENPIEIIINVSEADSNNPDSITVSGGISSPNPIVTIELERICFYGREVGIYPLAEPNLDGTVTYNKVGIPMESHDERYIANAEGSPLTYNGITETFSFTDPMNYYDDDGSIEEVGFKWNYARFDREAWKYIKRKKMFNMEKALSVEYRLHVTSNQSDIPISSAVKTGTPYLSTIAMAEFCLWLKEVALNRAWHMQVTRYCYSKSRDWLTDNQTIKSADNVGYIKYKASITGGSGKLSNFSDWEGIKIWTTKDISIDSPSITPNQLRKHSISTIVKTPIYSDVAFKINGLGVRDYTLQWGMWITDGQQKGTVTIQRDGNEVETVTTEQLMQIMPTYEGWSSGRGYSYDEKDYTGIEDHEPSTWTKINFKYPPTPGDSENGVWKKHESDWKMYYEVE